MRTPEYPEPADARHAGAAHPEIQAGELRELAAHVCSLCWDGEIKLPLVVERKVPAGEVPLAPVLSTGPRFADQGIDLFYDQQPVMRWHRCRQAKNEDEAGGVWEPVTVVVPASFYTQLRDLGGGITTDAGTPVLVTPREPLEKYTPRIVAYRVEVDDTGRITSPERPQQPKSGDRKTRRKLERQNRKAGRFAARR